MARISVHRPHHLSHAKAKKVAETLAEDLRRKFSLRYAWDGDHIEFQHTGLSGRLLVAPRELALDVELGFLLAGFRSSIEREIHRQLEELLGPAPAEDRASSRGTANSSAPTRGTAKGAARTPASPRGTGRKG